MRIGGWRTTRGGLAGLLCACLVRVAAAAGSAPDPLLTIVDGEATLIVGARALAATPGLRLPDATIVETSNATTLLRIEYPDGSALDLGPDTRVMVRPGALGRRGARAPAFYLLSGWAKQQSASSAPHLGHVSPLLDVSPSQGTSVAYVDAGLAWLFVESGTTKLIERGGAGARVNLPAGGSHMRRDGAKGETAERPDPEFLARVPRGFRDTIALRGDRLAGKEVAARALPAPDYAALRPWLVAETALRRGFPQRFSPLLRDSGFRSALVAQLNAHPEWERTLFPERFERNASSPIGGSR